MFLRTGAGNNPTNERVAEWVAQATLPINYLGCIQVPETNLPMSYGWRSW